MEDFKKELDALLQRFPELPEFKLTVRPRVVIETKQETKVDPIISAVSAYTPPPTSMDNSLNNILSRNPNIKVYEQ